MVRKHSVGSLQEGGNKEDEGNETRETNTFKVQTNDFPCSTLIV